MGCFNISGFYSHLPIKYGDRIGAVICARVNNCQENIAMEPFSTGIFPILAPVYGKYNDCGGIEEIDNIYSAELFLQVTGYSIHDFIENNYRNSSVTVNSKDNGNQFDDIPTYQEIIKNMIPTQREPSAFEGLFEGSTDPREIEIRNEYVKYEEDEFNNAVNSTFLVIYEHESVLKHLISVGYKRQNYTTYDDVQHDFSQGYDIVVAIQNKVDKLLGKTTNVIFRSMKKQMDIFKDAEEWDKSVNKDAGLFYLFDEDIKEVLRNTMFMRIYKNAENIDYAKLKSDFIDLMYLHGGLYMMHGSYAESRYAGQEIEADDFAGLHSIYKSIIDNLEK